MIEIRQIKADDWQVLKQVRLAALSDAPEAFSQTLEQAQDMPDSIWQVRAKADMMLSAVAIHDGVPCGLAVGLPDAQESDRAFLVSLWVAPAHRGDGTASSLLDLVTSWAVDRGAQHLFAGVPDADVRTETFLRKCGFETFGEELPKHPATSGCELVLSKGL